MLIVEKTSNGRTIVTIKRDWHPGRVSLAYVQKPRRMESHDIQWQKALCKPALV